MRRPALPRLSVVLAASALALVLAGCSRTDPIDPMIPGVDADIGPLQVRSLLVVSSGEDAPGRFLGTLSNRSGTLAEVAISDNNDTVEMRVAGDTDYGLDTNPAVFSSVSGIPGAVVPVSVSVGSESQELLIPVVDGTLEFYRPYLPSGSPTPSP